MNIKQINKYRLHLLNELNTDILAETLAATIVDDNIVEREDDVFFLPSNKNNRSFENDVMYTKSLKDEAYEDRYIEIGTSRASILNGLPQSFYMEYSNEEFKNKEEKIKHREAQQATLESANSYFKPIELLYNQTRIKRELKELRFTKNNSSLLYNFWGEQQLGSEEEKRFLKTMHLLPYIVGNTYRTEQLINYVLEKKSNISIKVETDSKLPKESFPTLGAMHLGVNTYVNNSTYTYQKTAQVHIHHISNKEFHLYYKRSQMHGVILNKIEKFYFPLDVMIEYEFYIVEATSFFKVDEMYENGNGILGYSTRI